MANGLLSNSRTTLLFAGGVIVCAVIAASSLSTDYAPKADRDGSEQEVLATASVETDELAAERRAEETETEQSNESVFGDYEGFDDDELIDDEDLIDDTMGFDPTPVDDETWASVSETSPGEVSETIIETPITEGSLTPVRSKLGGNSRGNPLQRKATPQDAKRQAAQLKKLRETRQKDQRVGTGASPE